MEKTGILIAARMASQRLPGKALIKISGRETVALLIERMKCCRRAGKLVLCTTQQKEDDVLAALGQREGVEVFRGESDNVAFRLLSASREHHLEHFVRVTGDDILRCIDLIDDAIAFHQASSVDYTYMKNVFYGGDSEVISVAALTKIVERAEEPQNTEYLSWYLDNTNGFRSGCIEASPDYSRSYRLSLDTREDLVVMEAIHDHFYRKGTPVDIVAVLKWLDDHPEVSSLNAAVRPSVNRDQMNCRLRP